MALTALGVGAVLTVPAWRFVGPWSALVVILVAIGVACAAYRVEPSRIDVDHLETGAEPPEPASSDRLDAR